MHDSSQKLDSHRLNPISKILTLFTRKLNTPKVFVWCGVGSFGPYSFEDENIRTLRKHATEVPHSKIKKTRITHQDEETAHTSINSMGVMDFPYKYQMAQHLSNQDNEAKLAFCPELLAAHKGVIQFPKDYFLNGMVNKQNFK